MAKAIIKAQAPEVFGETLSKKGNRELWRLKYRGPVGVQWEHLSSFHARIICIEVDGDNPHNGNEIAVIAGHGDRPFTFCCPLRWLRPDGYHRGFYARLVKAAGIAGICEVGKLAATVRAILQLTKEEAPIPRFEINQSAHRGKG